MQPRSNVLTTNLLILVLLSCCIFLTQTQNNTHQTIKTSPPSIYPVKLQQNDILKIKVGSFNGNFKISFNSSDKKVNQLKQDICFINQDCSLQLVAQQKMQGIVTLQMMTHQYSYEITINGRQYKKQQSVVNDFIGGQFIYTKYIKSKNYTLIVSYQSKKTKKMTLNFMGHKFTVFANKTNNVKIPLDQPISFYELFFLVDEKYYTKQNYESVIITVQLPNQFLKGCDGTNTYDSKLRICTYKSQQVQDILPIHKIGSYPTFEIKQQQKNYIKITIIESLKWRQFFQNQTLTMFLSNISDPKVFYNLTAVQLKSKFRTKQQCQFKSTACTFSFRLQPGQYSVMPVFLQGQTESFVYLYERSNGQHALQTYYSVLASSGDTKQSFYHYGGIIEFISGKQKMTQIIIQAQNKFLMIQHTIMGRSKVLSQQGQYSIQLKDIDTYNEFNKDLNKANIIAQLQPNSPHLLVFFVMSQQKFAESLQQIKKNVKKALDKQKRDEQQFYVQQFDEFGNQFDEDDLDNEFEEWDDDNGQTDFDQQQDNSGGQFGYLQSQIMQISIKNGRFPHKKVQVANAIKYKQSSKNDMNENKQNNLQTENDNKQSSQSIIYYIIVVVIVVVILILIIIFKMKLIRYSTNINENKDKQLNQQHQISDVNVIQTNLQISNIQNTQSNSQTSKQTQQHIDNH